jgi:hypothetical protein
MEAKMDIVNFNGYHNLVNSKQGPIDRFSINKKALKTLVRKMLKKPKTTLNEDDQCLLAISQEMLEMLKHKPHYTTFELSN